MDHLNRAAGQTEGHPPQGTGAGPGEEVLGGRDHEALLVQRLLEFEQLLLVDLAGNETRDARELLLRGHRVFGTAEHHSHSSAPFFHA